jgi:hypothetical protein
MLSLNFESAWEYTRRGNGFKTRSDYFALGLDAGLLIRLMLCQCRPCAESVCGDIQAEPALETTHAA